MADEVVMSKTQNGEKNEMRNQTNMRMLPLNEMMAKAEKDHGIWCEVSGGLTGTRMAWMKDEAGNQWTGTKDEAETKAAELMAKPRGGMASYRYTALELY